MSPPFLHCHNMLCFVCVQFGLCRDIVREVEMGRGDYCSYDGLYLSYKTITLFPLHSLLFLQWTKRWAITLCVVTDVVFCYWYQWVMWFFLFLLYVIIIIILIFKVFCVVNIASGWAINMFSMLILFWAHKTKVNWASIKAYLLHNVPRRTNFPKESRPITCLA